MPRISLRHLLVLVALLALAIVSLRYASAWWEAIMLCVTLVVFFAMVIVALVGRGPRQAFAIGMAVVMAGYAVVKFHEPTPTARRMGLPTTNLLFRLRALSKDVRYFDARTGNELVEYDPASAKALAQGAAGLRAYQSTVPLLEFFLPIGHFWWALLLGYVGGLFGRFVYLQRMKEQPLKT